MKRMEPQKVAVAGNRSVFDVGLVQAALSESGFNVCEIVTGGARGVDKSGETYANQQGLKLTVFPAHWGRHGRAAGPIRNRSIAEYADCLVAIWDGKSKGTANMVGAMKKLCKPVFIYKVL